MKGATCLPGDTVNVLIEQAHNLCKHHTTVLSVCPRLCPLGIIENPGTKEKGDNTIKGNRTGVKKAKRLEVPRKHKKD